MDLTFFVQLSVVSNSSSSGLSNMDEEASHGVLFILIKAVNTVHPP